MAILDSTIVKGDLTVTGTIHGLSGGGSGSNIEQITLGTSSLVTNSTECKVVFQLNSTTSALYDACPLIIFTMNNSFIVTPKSQINTMLCCGSFIYDGEGNTMIVRVRINKSSSSVTVTFDNNFRDAVLGHTAGGWGAMLIGIKF